MASRDQGSLPGRLSSETLDPVRPGELSKPEGVLVTHLGWSQDVGWVHLEQELLAVPTAGSGEKGLILINPFLLL